MGTIEREYGELINNGVVSFEWALYHRRIDRMVMQYLGIDNDMFEIMREERDRVESVLFPQK